MKKIIEKADVVLSIIPSEIRNCVFVENYLEALFEKYQIDTEYQGIMNRAVMEAFTNAVIHGNDSDPGKEVRISACKEKDFINITVEDMGIGFDFTQIPDLTLSQRQEKAVDNSRSGLYQIKVFADKVLFELNGAKITMSFKVTNRKPIQRLN